MALRRTVDAIGKRVEVRPGVPAREGFLIFARDGSGNAA